MRKISNDRNMQHLLKGLINIFCGWRYRFISSKCEADQSSPSSVVVKSEWGLQSLPHITSWGAQENPYFSVTL